MHGTYISCNLWEYRDFSLPLFPVKPTVFFKDEGMEPALMRNHKCSPQLLSTLCTIRATLLTGLRWHEGNETIICLEGDV